MVQPASMSRPETRETTPVLERHISLDEAYALMRESNPQTHTPDGKLIVYRVDLKPGEKSDRYLENTDPAHQ